MPKHAKSWLSQLPPIGLHTAPPAAGHAACSTEDARQQTSLHTCEPATGCMQRLHPACPLPGQSNNSCVRTARGGGLATAGGGLARGGGEAGGGLLGGG